MGHVILTVLGMVAQMERRFIKERQREGIDQAKAAGVYKGGKARIDSSAILHLRSRGMGVSEIARSIGCSRMQVYRVIKSADNGNAPL